MGTGNYSATSNDMKLVYILAVDGWAVPNVTAYTPINGQCTNHRIAMIRCSAVLMCILKG